MLLCGLQRRTGGAAAGLAVWLGLGALLAHPPRYGYPRKRKRGWHRLFLAFSVCAVLMGGMDAAVHAFLSTNGPNARLSDALSLAGAIGFSLPIGKWAFRLSLPRKVSWALGTLLCALFVLLS